MNTADILIDVEKAEPQLMMKTAKVLALTEKLYPECVSEIMSDIETICAVVNEKTAALPLGETLKGNLGTYAVAVGVTAGSGLLSAVATDLYDAAKRGLTKGRNLRRIMESNPNLKREVDRKQLEMAYNALHRYAPEFTADPLVGGALLRQVAELPQMSHKTIVELIGARKDLNDTRGRLFADVGKQLPYLLPKGKGDHDKPGE